TKRAFRPPRNRWSPCWTGPTSVACASSTRGAAVGCSAWRPGGSVRQWFRSMSTMTPLHAPASSAAATFPGTPRGTCGKARYWALRGLAADVGWGRNPVTRYTQYRGGRGMSVWHDWIDWLGGYPFEVATPEQILAFYRARGLVLTYLRTAGGSSGCNEFVLH